MAKAKSYVTVADVNVENSAIEPLNSVEELKKLDIFSHVPESERDALNQQVWEKVKGKEVAGKDKRSRNNGQ